MKTYLLSLGILLLISSSACAGVLVGWGDNNYGQCDVPDGNDFVGISAGRSFALALRSDGTLAAWGFDPWGQVSNLPDTNGFVAVAAGTHHGLALTADGTIEAWGRNVEGQCDVPAGRYIAVGAGAFHSLAIDVNGALVEWPFNPIEPNMVPVPEGSDFVAVEGGGCHSLALRSNGQLEAWRCNEYGECNVPDGNYTDMSILIYGGLVTNFALNTDGQIVAWSNCDGWRCDIPDGNGYQDIAPLVAIDANGAMAAWRDCLLWDYDGNEPVYILPQGNGFVAVDAGDCFGVALASSETCRLTVTVDPDWIDSISPAVGTHTYYYGEWAYINAPAHPNCPYVFEFTEWQGDVPDPRSGAQFITMTSDKTITAIYDAAERICGDLCHPILQGDLTGDCYVNFEDFAVYASQWLECTHPDCD